MKNHFLIQASKTHFEVWYITEYQDVKSWDTKMTALWINTKFQKRLFLLRSEISIFDTFFKGMYEEILEDS